MQEKQENVSLEADLAPESQSDLIFGRFHTLEEAQKALIEAEESLKRMEGMENALQEAQLRLIGYDKDAVARQSGFSDRFAMSLSYEVVQKELDDYLMAASYTLAPEKSAEVYQAVDLCRKQGAKADLTKIRSLFTPEVVALVSADTTVFKCARMAEYEKMHAEEISARYRRQIEAFRAEEPVWAADDFNADILKQAVELSDGKIDLKEVKTLIGQIEAEAVRKYQADADIRKENESVQNDLSAFEAVQQGRQDKKKWLTMEEYYALTPAQEAEKYDLIVEQIGLENKGLLPRMLTRK